MANLVPYQPQALARQHAEQVQSIVEVTQAAQRELSRIHTEGARLAIQTLTYTRERIQSAAANGMSAAKVASLVDQERDYLLTMQRIVNEGTAGLQAVVNN